MAEVFGESIFNDNATFFGDVTVYGNLNFDKISYESLYVRDGATINQLGIAQTALVVNGNARVTGILTVGSNLSVNTLKTVAGLPLLNSTGSIIQVVYGDMGSNTATITSADNAVIPNCSLSITPTRSTSKILLIAHVIHNAFYVSSFGFARNGTNIGGNNNTNSSNVISINYHGESNSADQGYCIANTYQYLDSPATTSAITYAPTACSSWSGVTYNLVINDRVSVDMRALTSITAMEILA